MGIKASRLPWFGWLAIAAAFAIAAALIVRLRDYIDQVPGKWGSGDFLVWVAIILLVPGGFFAITGVIRFLKWVWRD